MSRPGPDDPDAGFLGRWSARKRGLVEDLTPEPGAEQAPEHAETRSDATPEKSDEEVLQELGLPDPDSLKEGDDFSAFMNGAVPARLRNRALRKLWLSNPVLANLDEMVDYGEDFTDAATVVENMQTAYKVGKGWLKDVTEDDAEAEDAAETEGAGEGETVTDKPEDERLDEEPAEEPAKDAVNASSEDPGIQQAEAGVDLVAPSADPLFAPEELPPLPPRRMKFRVDEA